MFNKIIIGHSLYASSPILCLFLMSCAVGPNFRSPPPPATDSYIDDVRVPPKTVSSKGPGGKAQYLVQGRDIPGEWWSLYQSRALNALINKGLAHNPTLDAAQAALKQAQETMYSFIGAAEFPIVTGQFSAERERFSGNEFGLTNTPGNIFNLYTAAVNVSYTFDFFGKNRRQIEALCAQTQYQRFLLEGTYLTLTSNIVTTAITEASLRAQIMTTRELISVSKNQLEIVKKQFQLGGASRSDVLTQETQLATTLATLPPLEKNLAITRHALSVLVGELPSEHLLPEFYLNDLKLPIKLPLSLPSLLVRQRPDVRASEQLLHQACANVGVATANLFPQITLTGSYGGQSNILHNLFNASNNVWNITGQILQPIFEGGSLLAARRASIAAYNQAAAQYRQTVLQAFQNVADSLRALEFDAKTLKAQTEAEDAAKAAFILTQQQFKLGAVNYLSLLNAESQYQLARINRIQAEAARFTDTAALFQALGGGWWNRNDSPRCF